MVIVWENYLLNFDPFGFKGDHVKDEYSQIFLVHVEVEVQVYI